MKGGVFWIRTIESTVLCRRHLLGIAIDIKEIGAIGESLIRYASHTIGYSNRGQTRATFESIPLYALHTIGDSNRGQTRATTESPLPYVRHTVGDSNRGQTRAISESITPYARHTIGNKSCLTSRMQSICSGFYYSIAVVSRVIYRIPILHNN